jgi:hypothetical protein
MNKSAILESLNTEYPGFIPRPVSHEEAEYRHWKEIVCNRFIEAVLNHDREAIIRLADAATFLKGKLDDDFIPVDPLRDKLLKIKFRPPTYQRLTIRQIAEQVYDKKMLKHHAADGFSALRRICKQMQIRIRPSRNAKRK